ncbi:hypothetical protein [Chitinophaga sp.]|uniref:hypothetical protein n=1 Tax=Chitinophaga sp. TaxID=1869181 RepID=UPI002F92D66A
MDKAIELLNKSGKVFASGNMSMDVYYTYANEHQPDVLIDSLKGTIQLSGTNYRSELGNTLSVKNSRYSIIVFKEDKLLYVAGTGVADSTAGTSPVLLITTAIKQMGVKECNVTTHKDTTTIRFLFPENMTYRYMDIKMENRSGRIQEIQYVVKSTMIDQENTGGIVFEPYALVRTFFRYHDNVSVAASVFDEQQFFTRSANTLVPAAAYSNYEVFIGTPSN